MSTIHQMIWDNNTDQAIKVLNAYGSDSKINEIDKIGRSLLHVAVQTENTKLSHHLLDMGIKINTRDFKGRTPTYIAVNTKNSYLIQLLHSVSANFNIADNNGNTPLHIAVFGKDIGIVRQLLNTGIDTKKINKFKLNAMELALRIECHDIADIIYNAANNNEKKDIFEAVKDRDFASLKLMLTYCNVNSRDDNGNTPLHIAVLNGDVLMIKFLMKKGANKNIEDHNCLTALEYAKMIENKEVLKIFEDKTKYFFSQIK